jgi:2-iminobutanoate/2-iminopropanoate deaminase
MNKEMIHRDTAWDQKMHYSQGVKIGPTIYVSGQVALNDEGQIVGPGDIAVQTRRALENIQAVLAKKGATMRDVVKVTTFIAQRTSGSVSTYDSVFDEFFPTDCPASTLVEVKSLVLRDLLVEIEAVAVLGAGGVA